MVGKMLILGGFNVSGQIIPQPHTGPKTPNGGIVREMGLLSEKFQVGEIFFHLARCVFSWSYYGVLGFLVKKQKVPKSSILIRCSIIFTIYFGVKKSPYFWFNTHNYRTLWLAKHHARPEAVIVIAMEAMKCVPDENCAMYFSITVCCGPMFCFCLWRQTSHGDWPDGIDLCSGNLTARWLENGPGLKMYFLLEAHRIHVWYIYLHLP